MALDPRQLRAFLAVVETGSLGRAAQALHLTEPAVSRIVKRLEDQLGVQLFERRTTGMELTSYGQALVPHANLLSTVATHAVEEIDALRGLERGTLRIGAVASAATMILPPVLDRFLMKWPAVQVQIVEAVEDKLALALAGNTIDVVLSGAIPEDDDIVQVREHRFCDRYMVIASTEHPLRKRNALEMKDLDGEQWVMPAEDAEPRRLFNSLVGQLGVRPPHVSVETRSPAAIKAMVARTRFLGWLPEPLFAAERAAGILGDLPVAGMNFPRRFYVYRRRRSFTSPVLSRFLGELRATEIAS
ncbi:MAG: LysR family transcriptional regulator [Sphingomonadales bacterium]